MIIVARCKNCGGKRALFDVPARNVCPYCFDGRLEVVVRNPFEEMPIPPDVGERLDYEKMWKLARQASPTICKRVMEKGDLLSKTLNRQGDILFLKKELSEGPDHSKMYGKRIAIFAAALCKAAGREPREDRVWRAATDVGYRKFLLDQASSPKMRVAHRLRDRQKLARAVRAFWER